MRRLPLLLAAAAAAGGAVAAKRSIAGRMSAWDTNPDPTDGDPLGLPEGDHVEIDATDGARLHAFRCGDPDGPTIVLVHGFTESAASWGPVLRRLAASGFDVVAVDQRGHGRSQRGDAGYSTSTLAADLRSWYETLDLDDTVLVGHSMGGVAAMAFATDEAPVAAARVRSLVLVTTLASPIRSTLVPNRRLDPERAVAVLDRVAALERVGLFAMLVPFGTRPARGAMEVTRAAVLATDRVTKVDAYAMLEDFDLRPVLGSIAIPTLVVAGSHDGLTPLATNEAIVDLVPGARLEVLHGHGHQLAFEAPDALTDLVVQASKPSDAVGRA